MKIHLKNMVCDRCIYAVSNILNELNLNHLTVSLGEIDFGKNQHTKSEFNQLREKLEAIGFEFIKNNKSKLIEDIKKLIIERINKKEDFNKINISDYLSRKLNYEFKYLSNLFSSVEGITVEQYVINHKIEKIKELIVYDEMSLTEISYLLGYSSLSHLSNQFKKITGLSPSHFKKLKNERLRKSLDKV